MATQIFFIFTPNLGEMTQFDEHIFQMGWFSHQLVTYYMKNRRNCAPKRKPDGLPSTRTLDFSGTNMLLVCQGVPFFYNQDGSMEEWQPVSFRSVSSWYKSIVGVSFIWVFPKIWVPPNHPLWWVFSIINHPFWGTPIFGNTHLNLVGVQCNQPI